MVHAPSFFITLVANASFPTVPTINPIVHFSQFLSPYFTSLLVHKTIPTISPSTPFLYTLYIFHLPNFADNRPYNSHHNSFPLPQPLSQFRLCQGSNARGRFVRIVTVFCFCLLPQSMDKSGSTHNHWFLIVQTQKMSVLQFVASDEDYGFLVTLVLQANFPLAVYMPPPK